MKEKSIVRLVFTSYGNMLLAGILCLIVTFSIAAFNIPAWLMNVIVMVLVVPLYTALLYTPIWTEGDRNRNMVQFGHLEKDLTKGLKIGVFLPIPYLIWNLLLTFSKAGVLFDFLPLYKILNAHVWPFVTWLAPSPSVTGLSVGGLIGCWLLSFYPTIVSVVAYILGYKAISVSEKLIYKNKPRKKRHY